MTTFRALPVRQGDAFLLTTASSSAYLVDGGRRSSRGPSLPDRLVEAGVSRLRAAVVTHTDRDHVEGIEGLLRYRFPVDEYWVPVEWLDTAHTARLFEGGWREWVQHARRAIGNGEESTRRPERGTEEVDLRRTLWIGGTKAIAFAYALAAGETRDERVKNRIDDDLDRLFGRRGELSERTAWEIADRAWSWPESWSYYQWPYYWRARPWMASSRRHRAIATTARTLFMIGRASMLLHDQPRVRFFEYQGRRVDYPVPEHPFVCLNASEAIAPVALPPAAFERVSMMVRSLSLTRTNRESRVFQYSDGVDVLFCADSRLSFLDKKDRIDLRNPAIATVPHHGARANAGAYRRVSAPELTWVRSDRVASKHRPCAEYVALPRKYCTACGDVELFATKNGWVTKAAPCVCSAR